MLIAKPHSRRGQCENYHSRVKFLAQYENCLFERPSKLLPIQSQGYICHFSSHRGGRGDVMDGNQNTGRVGHWSKYRIENRGVARLPVIIHRLSHSWDSVGKFGALSFGFGHRPPVPFTLTSVSPLLCAIFATSLSPPPSPV